MIVPAPQQLLAVFQVHCLKLWRQRSKEPPETMPRCLHEWIKTANGHMDLDVAAFCAFVWPVVEELYRKGKGTRPTPEELTGALYDALSEAGSRYRLPATGTAPKCGSRPANW